MEEDQHIEDDKPYRSSMWMVTRWLLVIVFVTLIIAFFKPINIWINRGETVANVISIHETYNLNDPYISKGYNFNKTYWVKYEFEVNGKYYVEESEMKFNMTLDPNSPANSRKEVSPADVGGIKVVYCRHWPGWFYVKNSRVDWK